MLLCPFCGLLAERLNPVRTVHHFAPACWLIFWCCNLGNFKPFGPAPQMSHPVCLLSTILYLLICFFFPPFLGHCSWKEIYLLLGHITERIGLAFFFFFAPIIFVCTTFSIFVCIIFPFTNSNTSVWEYISHKICHSNFLAINLFKFLLDSLFCSSADAILCFLACVLQVAIALHAPLNELNIHVGLLSYLGTFRMWFKCQVLSISFNGGKYLICL